MFDSYREKVLVFFSTFYAVVDFCKENLILKMLKANIVAHIL